MTNLQSPFHNTSHQSSLTSKNQRTSGPVNAHLTPGPGIYFNAFVHVYSPRAGADNPLGTNVDVNRKPLSLCPFVASFKTISLKYDFKHILNDLIHVYSPRAGTRQPLGDKILIIRDFNGHLAYPFQNPISNFYLSLEAGKSSTDSVILRKLTKVEIIFRAWTKSLKRTKMYFDD